LGAGAIERAEASFDVVVTSCTYGNRMADLYDGRDGTRRNTYRVALGHALHNDNSGGMQWGDAYREFHKTAWQEVYRVLKPRGMFYLNVSDHIRDGAVVRVAEWHHDTAIEFGFKLYELNEVPTPRNRAGANGNLRVEHEVIYTFFKAGA